MNKGIYSFLISLLIITIGFFGFDSTFEEIKGVNFDDEIIRIAAPGVDSRTKIFTNQFDIDISPDVTSVNIGFIKFSPQPSYGNWIITKNQHSGDNSFSDWMKQTVQGNDIRKDISLNLRDNQGNTVRTINCFDAFPVYWNHGEYGTSGYSGEVLEETLIVSCGRVDMG